MTRFKKAILFIHRWLGFISGLVVFIVSITGCIFCFQDEIQDAIHSYRKIEVQQTAYLGPSVLKAAALQKYPGAKAAYIYYYGKNRPAAVLADMSKDEFNYIYLDPYKGNILHAENPQTNFFTVVEYIHLYLLLPPKIGGLIVGVSVIIFLVLMITGIILWWPKRKSDRKRSFNIKWNGRWRRLNYDLHNVLGFYATSIAVILAISGLSIAFDWVTNGIYTTANLGKQYPAEKIIPKSDTINVTNTAMSLAVDKAFEQAQQQSPKMPEMFLIYDPAGKSESIGVTAYAQSLHYYKSDSYYFDKHSGKQLGFLPHTKKSAGLKMNEMNYDIHVGQILGLTGKIIAFLASLICASLPVTGFIVWFGERRKKPKNKKLKEVAHRKTHARLITN